MKYFLRVLLATAIINGWCLFPPVNAEKDNPEEDITSLKNEDITECCKEHNNSTDLTIVLLFKFQYLSKSLLLCLPTNVTEAIKDIMTYVRVSKDQGVKCWLHCLLNKINMILDENLDWGYRMTISKIGLNDDDKAQVDEIAEICQAEAAGYEEKKCRHSYRIVICMIKNWKKLGHPKVT